MKIFLRLLTVLFIACCAAGGYVYYEATKFLDTPPQEPGEAILFDVPAGASLSGIAASLAEKGIITNSRYFTWLARWQKAASRLQAGRFELNTGWKPEQVLDTLINGKPYLTRLTIPEGLTWWQTARLLEQQGFARYDDFAAVIQDADFLRHYGIPFKTAEGFLMPDTYLLRKPDSPMPEPGFTPQTEEESKVAQEWRDQARSVAGRLIDNFWRKLTPLSGPERLPTAELRRAVTLASIVEKETAIPGERPRVAGVYANRLDKGMLLQADPTVIYGLGEDFSGSLTRRQLEDASNPYNTYRLPGLPPGPICSFGASAFRAATQPEKHDFLYFVAVTDGGAHRFSRTLNEHNAAVRDYRRQKR